MTIFTSNMICVNSPFNKNDGFQSLSISCTLDLNTKSKKRQRHYILYKTSENMSDKPFWFFKKFIVVLKTVDLSIFLLVVDNMRFNSLIKLLN